MCLPSFRMIVVSLVSALLLLWRAQSLRYMVGLEASILKRQEVPSLEKIIHSESYTSASNQKKLKSIVQTHKVEQLRQNDQDLLGIRLHSPNQPKHI